METKNQINNVFTQKRLLSLDVFRGLTIMGMIIVNDPGSWSHVYDPLLHANWHGITPTDLVFPFFLFIVGVSIVLAYSKRSIIGTDRSALILKLLKRSAVIFLLGVFLWINGILNLSDQPFIELLQRLLIIGLIFCFLFFSDDMRWQPIMAIALIGLAVWWFPENSISRIRIPGVLQRIALVYFACSLIFLYTDWKKQTIIGGTLLGTYYLLMCFIPVPVDEVISQALLSGEVKAQSGMIPIGEIQALSKGWIAANLEPGTNLEAWIDRKWIPGRMWQHTWDPEGILSTIPSIATGITGMLVGKLILSKMVQDRKLIWLFALGFMGFLSGTIWDWFFPINKNLWSSSYVLYTSGLATMSLATCIWFVDVLGYKKWVKPAIIFGVNAITAYVLHGLLGGILNINFGEESFRSLFMNGFLAMGLAHKLVSLLWALFYLGLCFIPIWILYKKKIYIKV